MINFPTMPNSVSVSMVQNGCLKAEFDSTYPIHLNGIISQNEFQESINNINRRISSNKILVTMAIVFGLSTISGIILFIVGGVKSGESHSHGFPVLVAVGFALGGIGMIVFTCGILITLFRRETRMRAAITEESIKYSSRSPIPCSWRLDTSRAESQGYGYRHNNQLIHHLVIDIGRSVAPGIVLYQSNPVAANPVSIYERQDYYAPPLYYSTLAEFCSNCNAPKGDSSSTFCTSCGHLFNAY
ncbi:unnamed protein product [Rotaria sp. Silwood2]|nr:unnamed protein product [Rotaria sp. Silwood2]CAF3193561.1 unnamed protein product [Rotaria sp. Silwood2]CAF3446335.1 unnamed protein product [Rotaria sp. Silwood2]CAF4560561.1 unnamed protein product [Rotaria sp. Silwood2]CAF4570835.1 unnamed protein product [Rotaria sp. Silwood2]